MDVSRSFLIVASVAVLGSFGVPPGQNVWAQATSDILRTDPWSPDTQQARRAAPSGQVPCCYFVQAFAAGQLIITFWPGVQEETVRQIAVETRTEVIRKLSGSDIGTSSYLMRVPVEQEMHYQILFRELPMEETVPPSPGSHYYLVVPHDGDVEGSYGTDRRSLERKRPVGACLRYQTFTLCPS